MSDRATDTVFRWAELEPLVSRFPSEAGILPADHLFYAAPPADLERVVRARPANSASVTGVSPDKVLDEELVARAR